jgi:probable F420-dependent oxidoreductase
MRIGLHALGIGTGARPEIIESVARAAQAAGFATLWCGEHVVMVDRPSSRYPYSADGRIAVPADADWLDPLLGLSYAAAVTDSIGVATGVLLLPEHNPVVVAKQAATLDVLSEGRLTLGVGIGWSADEFAALGVPFERRAERSAEYIAAMRRLWTEDVASFDGEFAAFGPIRVNPKPVRGGQIPVVIGGNSDAALRRVAAYGDGWYGFNVEIDDVRDRLAVLREQCRRHGRKMSELTVALAVSGCGLGDIPGLADAGVTELVVLGSPPPEPVAAAVWVDEQARRWGLGPDRPRLTSAMLAQRGRTRYRGDGAADQGGHPAYGALL